MLIQSIKLKNLLSFGPDAQEIKLGPLNVLIGPNGSGKSNLIEAISLLQAAPRDLIEPVWAGGGIRDWIWHGESDAMSASIEVIVEYPDRNQPLRYRLGLGEKEQRFEIIEERIENAASATDYSPPEFYYKYYESNDNRAYINFKDNSGYQPEQREIDPRQSILAQLNYSYRYSEPTYLANMFVLIRLYREWSFSQFSPPRLPQKEDQYSYYLNENGQNLNLVMNKLIMDPEVKSRVLEALRNLYEGISDFGVIIEGGARQVYLKEGHLTVPANRLSTGTMRFLCLLAVLCQPTPPPLVCIEEPEMGLHPDILPDLAKLLREASERCQLIVTTHSDTLIDSLTETPESIVVCEKHDGQTTLSRLDKSSLDLWLQDYRLGELWSSGELGGNRW